MGMLLRRWHAAKFQKINKNDAFEEYKEQESILNNVVVEEEVTPQPEKRKYTKRSEVTTE